MSRLIEIQDVVACAPSLTVKAGDLLVFYASGGRVNTGGSAIRLVGAFLRAVVGTNRMVIEPIGSPNSVVFEALHPGSVTIDVITGDPFGAATVTTLLITVTAA